MKTVPELCRPRPILSLHPRLPHNSLLLLAVSSAWRYEKTQTKPVCTRDEHERWEKVFELSCVLLLHHLWIAAPQREESLSVDTATPGTLSVLRGKTCENLFYWTVPIEDFFAVSFCFVLKASIDSWGYRADQRTRKKRHGTLFFVLFCFVL